MQTLAVGGESTFSIGVLPAGRLVSFALAPAQTGLAVLFDAPLLVVVVGVVGASLSLHPALQASFFPGIGRQFLTEGDQVGFAMPWNNGKRLRADIQAERVWA